jgi:hypothetical protein
LEKYIVLKAALTLFLLIVLMIAAQPHAYAESISLPGFSVKVPDGDGWSRVKSGNDTVRYERKSAHESSMFEFTTAKIDESARDETFLKETEVQLERHFVERGVLSRHYNYTHNKGVACVVYDAIIRQKTKEAGLEFRKGWICRLPTDKSRMARLEAIYLAKSRSVEAERVFLALADSVLSTVVFVKPTN